MPKLITTVLQDKELDVESFKSVATALLKKHYALDLNDTLLTDDHIVQQCIAQGYRPFEVINEHASEADLERIDVSGDYGIPSKLQLIPLDEEFALNTVVQQ